MSVFSAQTSLVLVAKFFDHNGGHVVVYVVVLVLRILILGVLVLLLGLVVVVGVPLVIVNFLATSRSIKTQKNNSANDQRFLRASYRAARSS